MFKKAHVRAAAGQQYAIIVGLIAVIAIAAISSAGISMSSLLGKTSNTMQAVVNDTVGSGPVIQPDVTAPVVSSITPPSDGTYGSGQSIDFTVIWSEPVTVTGTPRISLTVGASGVNANYFSGSGSNTIVFRYVVGPTDNDSNGIAATSPINLNSGTIKDLAGNSATLAFTPPNLTGVLVDSAGPAVSSITPPTNGVYSNGFSLNFTVNWSKAATVTGTPRIQLTVGAATRYASYISGSGTTNHLYRYTIQASDGDNDGVVAASPIDLNGGTIKDTIGNNASLTFSPPAMNDVLVQGNCTAGSANFSPGGSTTFTVPPGCVLITVKAWGAGGGGGGGASVSGYCGGNGGGAGYARATIGVTPGEVLTISVGTGGSGGVNSANGGAGGAGYGGSNAAGGPVNTTTPGGTGSGGGGGGGGGANTSGSNGASGGGGGGASGVLRSSTWLVRGAGGGGGGGGGGNSTHATSGTAGGSDTGNGGIGGINAGNGGPGDAGAGGGGGGGTGSSYSGTATGGNGGTNLVTGSATTNIAGSVTSVGTDGDFDYVSGRGVGGAQNCSGSTGTTGGAGFVVIRF